MSHLLTYSADYKPTFPEWLARRHDTTSRELYTMFQATGSFPYREYKEPMECLLLQYRQDMKYQRLNRLLTYSADYKPTFREWLTQRHGTTSRELYTMFQATSCHPYREYQNAMSYLRWQYRRDMEYRKLLLASNPFTEEAENTNNQGGAETPVRQNGG